MGIFSGMLNALFPPACLACRRVLKEPDALCPPCKEAVERLPSFRCGLCAEPGDFTQGRCPRCSRRPPPFSASFAPFLHAGAMARAIHRFKYEDHPELAEGLAALLAAESTAFLRTAPPLIAAIPLHERRFLARKYDQAELLAGALSKRIGRPRLLGALDRVRETKRQVGLTELQREQNLRGAFAASVDVRGQSVLLIDDVFTTGATARAAATALRAAGARDVQILCLARAYGL